jgi:hypothetical protein
VVEVSLCRVASDPGRYVGRSLKLSARFVSDSKHEEVLEEMNCAGGRMILDIGRRAKTDSVKAFYESVRAFCLSRGATYLCNVSGSVRIVGSVGVMSDQFVLHLDEVQWYEIEERTGSGPAK